MNRDIEIRANANYPILAERHPENRIKNAQFLAYCKGATDQNGIDVKIAIEAHCSFCKAHNACVDRGSFCCPETEYIRKVMEGTK